MSLPENKPAGYVPWITCITFVYLIFELSFNARLLDVIGCAADNNATHNIENWGRILSGIAVTILVWGTLIMPRARFPVGLRLVLMGVTCILCTSTVYSLEEKLVTHLVDLSTGEQRKEAVTINFVTNGLQNGTLTLSGLPLTVGTMASPSEKQVMAILPFYILSIDNLDMKITDGLLAAIHNSLVNNGGDAQTLFDKGYKPFVNHMHDLFQQYAALETRHARNPSQGQIIYQQHLRDIFGDLPNHIYERFSDFFMSPEIQDKALQALGIDQANKIAIMPNLNPVSFRLTLWPQIINYRTHETFEQKIDHPASDYVNDAPQSDNGRNAMEAIVAPPLALFFSVLGALTHIFKGFNYLLQWRIPNLRFRKTILISILGLAAFVVGQQSNTIVSLPLYQMMVSSVSTYYPHGNLIGVAITWLIKMQAMFYPLNETIRRTLLLGMSFGA